MKYGLRILVAAAALTVGVLASGLIEAQGDIRVTPLTSPIALWCTGDGNQTIMAYRFDKDGTSHFAWRYTPGVTVPGATAESTAPASSVFADNLPGATPEATAVASNPGNGALIDQEGVGLYLNADGRYSALTTQWDGKQFVFFFEGCPNAGATNAYVIDTDGSWIPVSPD
jgi:hypothetical protein